MELLRVGKAGVVRPDGVVAHAGAVSGFSAPDLAIHDFTGSITPAAAGGVWSNDGGAADVTADHPLGGGLKCMQQHYGPAADVGGIGNRADINKELIFFPNDPVTHGQTVFYRGKLYFPSDIVNLSGATLRKLLYFRTGDGGTNQCDLVVNMTGTTVHVDVQVPNTTSFTEDVNITIGAATRVSIEMGIVMNSAPGVADGTLTMWFDGVQTYTKSGIAFTRSADLASRGFDRFSTGTQREGTGAEGTVEEYRCWDSLAFSTKRVGP